MSLRFKIVVAIVALILGLGLGGTLYARVALSSISEDQLEKRGVALASDLESHASELLLTNDIFGLYGRMSNLLMSNNDVRYIVVFGPQGEVKASTFPEGLPVGLREANAVTAGQKSSVKTMSTSEGSVLDVAVPVLDGRAGTIRLGISKGPLENELAELTFTLIALTGGVLFIGLVVAYLLATLFTRPLGKLAEAAQAVGQGELFRRVHVGGRDEVGRLAAAFDAMTEKLEEKEEERTRLLARVISAQEDERKRIARELHDEASQALTSLMLGLKHLEGHSGEGPVQRKAAELRLLVADTLDLMHNLALELRPTALDDLGLVAALERYIRDYANKHGINVDFHAGSLAGGRLPPQEETALYRIVQEALTNVVRHAGASNVSILLEQRDSAAVVIVEDDGRGFDLEAVKRAGGHAQRLGLLGMEERASLIGGRLTIESRPGGGTAVFVEIPIARNS